MVSTLRTGVVAPWTTAPRTANPKSGTGAPATARDAPCGPAHRREGRVRRAPDVLMLIELWDDLTVDGQRAAPRVSPPRTLAALAASPGKEALLTEGASRLSPLGFHPEEVSTAVGPGGPSGAPASQTCYRRTDSSLTRAVASVKSKGRAQPFVLYVLWLLRRTCWSRGPRGLPPCDTP